MIGRIADGTISNNGAKQVFDALWTGAGSEVDARSDQFALGAVLFFLVSNFGVWLTQELYPHSAAGLAACYVAALPFFTNIDAKLLTRASKLVSGKGSASAAARSARRRSRSRTTPASSRTAS